MTSITAIITARGADTTVPDNAGAVDAEILIGDTVVCGVTLLPDPANGGALSKWGDCVDCWCSAPGRAAEIIGEGWQSLIVQAVRRAAR